MKILLPKKISSKFGESIAHLVFDVLDPLNQQITVAAGPVVIDVSPCEFIIPFTNPEFNYQDYLE